MYRRVVIVLAVLVLALALGLVGCMSPGPKLGGPDAVTQDTGVTVKATTGTVTVEVKDSTGAPIQGASVSFYKPGPGGRPFPRTDSNGQSTGTLPETGNWDVTVSVFNTSQSKTVYIGTDPVTISFQTSKITVKLETCAGTPLAGGKVRSRGNVSAGTWFEWGTTGSDGTISKEIFPGNWWFSVEYRQTYTEKQQDVVANPVVTFKTTKVWLYHSGTIQYWGNPSSGTLFSFTNPMEMLPGTIRFIFQGIGEIPIEISGCEYKAALVIVELKDNSGNRVQRSGAAIFYQPCGSDSYIPFGDGILDDDGKEVAPAPIGTHRYRMTYLGKTVEKETDATIVTYYVSEFRTDTTPPVITIATGQSDTVAPTGWYNIASSGTDSVQVIVSASDPSGVVSITVTVVTNDTPTTLSFTGASGSFTLSDGIHSVSATAKDNLGNTGVGSGSTPMPVIFRIDQTLPKVNPPYPAPTYILNQPEATISAIVTDATSGPAASPVTVPVSTAAVGSFTAPATGFDNAGNSDTVYCSYNVKYGFSGLLPPYQAPPTTFKLGRTIPLKWQYTDYTGTVIDSSSAAPYVEVRFVSSSVGEGDSISIEDPGTSGRQYDPLTYTWQFNWQTKGLSTGTYAIYIVCGQTGQRNGPFLIQLRP